VCVFISVREAERNQTAVIKTNPISYNIFLTERQACSLSNLVIKALKLFIWSQCVFHCFSVINA